MNWNYLPAIPADFAPDSRVWIYQSSRLLSMSEALHTEDLLNTFVANWKSHGTPVKGFGTLLFGQFVILMADERATGVSGCSTDSSVRFVKQLEDLFKVQLFDRQLLAFQVKDKVQLLPLSQLQHAIDHGFVSADTLYFNNLVQTKEELETKWMIPIEDSWLSRRIAIAEK